MTGAPEHRHAVAMPGERHIDRVTVHPAVPKHQRVIHRHNPGIYGWLPHTRNQDHATSAKSSVTAPEPPSTRRSIPSARVSTNRAESRARQIKAAVRPRQHHPVSRPKRQRHRNPLVSRGRSVDPGDRAVIANTGLIDLAAGQRFGTDCVVQRPDLAVGIGQRKPRAARPGGRLAGAGFVIGRRQRAPPDRSARRPPAATPPCRCNAVSPARFPRRRAPALRLPSGPPCCVAAAPS